MWFVWCSSTGRGSAAVVESVQRHRGLGSNDEEGGSTDYSLRGIDQKRIRHLLSEIIQNNKERWKELSVQGVFVFGHIYSF